MADTLKILAQANPLASVLTDVYTVPGATTAMVSSFVVCNQSNTAITFRVAVAQAGATDATKQYLYYDETIPPNKSFAATLGITLAATDVFRVQTSTGLASVNLFGVEVS